MPLTDFFDVIEFNDVFRISYLANAIVIPAYEEVQRDFGLKRGEYLLLACLSLLPVLTAQDVATMTRRPRNTISRAVNKMLAEEYIVRAPDPDDRRQLKLSITPSGRALHKKIAQRFVTRQEKILSVLSAKERKSLDGLLNKLVRHAATLDI
ncbi:MarR family transcriptional regulator [Sneathiella marina]|uniref:MarR family transcriptional regulator n=1 Tax=Sneathiella marina TaxID=2950108 RepID=A0ABY4VZL9_9PROT|nr:MarR family transcriptional regulator [Sneathiella marina]USG60330.1 MarR family transcriptional regulator [Sneathiella marina]